MKIKQPQAGDEDDGEIEVHQALIVFGLQNDFVGPNPRLPVPRLEEGWLERIKTLIPKFRESAGSIIFVGSEVGQEELKAIDSDRVILDTSDTDTGPDKEGPLPTADAADEDDLKDDAEDVTGERSPSKKAKKKGNKKNKNKNKNKSLTDRMAKLMKDITNRNAKDAPLPPSKDVDLEKYRRLGVGGPTVRPGSDGAAFVGDIQALITPDEDIIIMKKAFSAFKYTTLIFQLRSKFITELYMVGCVSNMSIYATAVDAASHGFKINLVQDCLGYWTQSSHDLAMRYMVEHMGAYLTSSSALITAFDDPFYVPAKDPVYDSDDDGRQTPGKNTEDLTAAFDSLGLDSRDEVFSQDHDMSFTEHPEPPVASALHRRSLNHPSPARLADEAQGLSLKELRSSKSTQDIRGRGNVRVRMRKRKEADVPLVPELPGTGGNVSDKTKTTQFTQDMNANKEKRKNAPQKDGEGTR